MSKTMEELQSYKNRLEADVRRSRLIDDIGVTRNSPLVKNLEQVNRDIKALSEKA